MYCNGVMCRLATKELAAKGHHCYLPENRWLMLYVGNGVQRVRFARKRPDFNVRVGVVVAKVNVYSTGGEDISLSVNKGRHILTGHDCSVSTSYY